jgi:single-strand DNA-binding protein
MTKDPQLKFTPGTGTAVTTFTIAVNRRFKKEGQPEADFIHVVVWGKQAESTANYMSKGKLLSVAGRIETRSYEAKDGGRRYVTEVIADEVSFLEFGNKNEGQTTQQNNGIPGDYFGGADYIPDDSEDMPF